MPPDAARIGAEPGQDLGGSAPSILGHRQHDVPGADVVVAEPERLAQRQLERRLGPRRERDPPGRRLPAVSKLQVSILRLVRFHDRDKRRVLRRLPLVLLGRISHPERAEFVQHGVDLGDDSL